LEEAFAGAKKTFQFDDEDEAAQWRKGVIEALVSDKEKYKGMDKEKFTEFFNTVAKAQFDLIQKAKEKIIAKYLKSKKGGSGSVRQEAQAEKARKVGRNRLPWTTFRKTLKRRLKKSPGNRKSKSTTSRGGDQWD
jgi:hypothetical protein